MSATERRLRNLLLMALAIQCSIFGIVSSELILLYLSLGITTLAIGNEAFWVFEIDKAIDR